MKINKRLIVLIGCITLIGIWVTNNVIKEAKQIEYLQQFPSMIESIEVTNIENQRLALYFDEQDTCTVNNGVFCILGLAIGISDDKDVRSLLESLPQQRKVNYHENFNAVSYSWRDYHNFDWHTNVNIVMKDDVMKGIVIDMSPFDPRSFTVDEFQEQFGNIEWTWYRFISPSVGADSLGKLSLVYQKDNVRIRLLSLFDKTIEGNNCARININQIQLPVYRMDYVVIDNNDIIKPLTPWDSTIEAVTQMRQALGCD